MFLRIFFTLYFLFPSILFAHNGYLLILHGTPCAGKTTLSEKLQNAHDFYPVKKTPFSLHLKADYIEKVTGERPETMLDILEKWVLLSPPKEVRKKVHQETWRLTFRQIRELVLEGKKVILDTCLTDPFLYDAGWEDEEKPDPLKNRSKVFTVLLYTPLSVLLERI